MDRDSEDGGYGPTRKGSGAGDDGKRRVGGIVAGVLAAGLG
jgi:hypothetical protein